MPDTPPELPDLAVTGQDFEAAVFGAPVWKLTLGDRPKEGDVRALVESAGSGGVALVSCRLPDGDARAGALEAAGFRRIERLLTFEVTIEAGQHAPADLAGEAEAEACAAIAADVFTHDRYHADPAVPDAVADEIKQRWVLNGVRGRADAPIVARAGGAVAGFNLCMRRDDLAVIDLIGVARAHQGSGLGRGLVRAALAHYSDVCAHMRVGTQDTNAASIALYEREGFGLVEAAETFHWTPRSR